MSTSKPVPPVHFQKKLAYTISNIKAACGRYDDGQFFAAQTIASDLALLILDKRDRKTLIVKSDGMSLLRRMGLYPSRILDRSMQAVISQSHLHGPVCAVGFERRSSIGYFPILDGFTELAGQATPMIPAEEWWEANVLRDRYGNLFTRRSLLETFRDKIANHTDEAWPEEFLGLSFEGSIGSVVRGPIVAYGDVDTVRVAIRQMAHEVLSVIDHEHVPIFSPVPASECNLVGLVEVQEEISPGEWVTLTDRGTIELHLEVTSCKTVADDWQMEASTQPFKLESVVSEAVTSSSPTMDSQGSVEHTKPRRMRLVLFNPSPSAQSVGLAQVAPLSTAPSHLWTHE